MEFLIGDPIRARIILGTWSKILLTFSTVHHFSRSWEQSAFSPPPERAAYLEAKSTLSTNNPEDVDTLKKLLMKRALKTIPFVLQLQNEGSSIERLYKKGMLTDNMHFKVKELKSFIDEEFQEVQFEADNLVQGWGQIIWPQAMQFHQMILKQTEDKPDEQKGGDEDKKKVSQFYLSCKFNTKISSLLHCVGG